MFTKLLFSSITAALAGLSLLAAPVDKSKISADAKWVLHLDADAFRATKFGEYFITHVLQPKLEGNEQLKKLHLSINSRNISSVTAYGPAFEKTGEGVLMLSTTADVKKDLDTFVGMSSLAGGDKTGIMMVQQKPYFLYSLNNGVFIAPDINGVVLVAKSKEQIEQARGVLLGQAPSMARSERFSGYPDAPSGYFFLAMADEFNQAQRLPAQAQVLKEARGGRVLLGEKHDELMLNLVFRGRDEAGATKIQQVLQGLVALLSLSQQDKDVTDLANATKISAENQNVIVDLHFPVASAIDHLDLRTAHHLSASNADEDQPHKAKKKKHNREPEAESRDTQSN